MQPDNYHMSLNLAFRYLAVRPRSIMEIRQKLVKNGFSAEVTQRVLDQLIELDYIDDKEFASLWVRERIALRPRGRYLIKQELLAKGIGQDLIEEVLDREFPATMEVELCSKLAAKKLKVSLQSTSISEKSRRKLIDSLRRKGFSWECIREACQDLLAGNC